MAKPTNQSADILRLPLHVRAEMAMKAAFEKLVRERLRNGSSLIVWRNGQVVALQGQELQDLLSKISVE
jgi:hypothetical protein